MGPINVPLIGPLCVMEICAKMELPIERGVKGRAAEKKRRKGTKFVN
jgi:hypothetical protein